MEGNCELDLTRNILNNLLISYIQLLNHNASNKPEQVELIQIIIRVKNVSKTKNRNQKALKQPAK